MIFAVATTSDPVVLSLVGIVGTVITALFALLKANTNALTKVAKSSEKVAIATTKSAHEAKTRNGHLGDQNMKLAQLVTDQNKDVSVIKENTAKTAEVLSKSALIAAEDRDLLVGGSQTVLEQNVAHQVVKNKE